MKRRTTFLYLISCERTDTVKVGISNTPENRLRQLQTASPFELKLVEIWPVDPTQAKQIESFLHRSMHDERLKGGWFAVHEQVASVNINVWLIVLSEGRNFDSFPGRVKFCGRKYPVEARA